MKINVSFTISDDVVDWCIIDLLMQGAAPSRITLKKIKDKAAWVYSQYGSQADMGTSDEVGFDFDAMYVEEELWDKVETVKQSLGLDDL